MKRIWCVLVCVWCIGAHGAMVPVQSSNLNRVGYDGGVLVIEFKSGGVYEYDDVLRDVFDALMAAPSHGKYFHRHIRNIYAFKRIK